MPPPPPPPPNSPSPSPLSGPRAARRAGLLVVRVAAVRQQLAGVGGADHGAGGGLHGVDEGHPVVVRLRERQRDLSAAQDDDLRLVI